MVHWHMNSTKVKVLQLKWEEGSNSMGKSYLNNSFDIGWVRTDFSDPYNI